MPLRGVIFDLGGVVLDSPLHAIARFENDRALPSGFVNRLVVSSGPQGAWQRLERGEIDLETFYTDFDTEAARAGQELSAREMMERIRQWSQPRPVMLNAISRLRQEGLKVAALTNNWATADGRNENLEEHFHVFVESSKVGLRKPDPRIYRLTCERLEIEPTEAAFLDDIGANLKSARALGMLTIKVVEPESAVEELAQALGLDLAG